MLAGKDFVADPHDQVLLLGREPASLEVHQRRGLLDGRVCGNHLAGDQILADAEMLKRSLSLRAPKLIGLNVDGSQAIVLDAGRGHRLTSAICLIGKTVLRRQGLRAPSAAMAPYPAAQVQPSRCIKTAGPL